MDEIVSIHDIIAQPVDTSIIINIHTISESGSIIEAVVVYEEEINGDLEGVAGGFVVAGEKLVDDTDGSDVGKIVGSAVGSVVGMYVGRRVGSVVGGSINSQFDGDTSGSFEYMDTKSVSIFVII